MNTKHHAHANNNYVKNVHTVFILVNENFACVRRKNDERKKLGFFPVHIPLRCGVSVFRVCIPLAVVP